MGGTECAGCAIAEDLGLTLCPPCDFTCAGDLGAASLFLVRYFLEIFVELYGFGRPSSRSTLYAFPVA